MRIQLNISYCCGAVMDKWDSMVNVCPMCHQKARYYHIFPDIGIEEYMPPKVNDPNQLNLFDETNNNQTKGVEA